MYHHHHEMHMIGDVVEAGGKGEFIASHHDKMLDVGGCQYQFDNIYF